MRGHWMQLAVLVTVLSLAAGCGSAVPAQPSPTPPAPTAAPTLPLAPTAATRTAAPPATQAPPTQPPATQAQPTQAPATQAPPTQPPTTAPSATPPSKAPAADLLAVVEAFQEAYNRHDVDATAGLLGRMACMDWGAGSRCGSSKYKDLFRYDAALNSELEISDCSVEGDRVTCKATQRNVCLAAGGLDETHYPQIVFRIQGGKIAMMTATRVLEEVQRESLFLYALAGWAHRTRPAEWNEAGRWDLLNVTYPATFNSSTGAVMATLCQSYEAVAAAAPVSTPAPPQISTPTGAPGRVLFIGDSSLLGLDRLFPRLAASGEPPMTVESKLNWEPGGSLAGHYELGTALDDIRQGQWDVVVLEDDLAEDWPGRAAEFYEYGRRFGRAIRQAGAETVFYMIHPWEHAEETTTAEITAAYTEIGQELGAKVAPVALAFQRSLRERPDLHLHATEGHPNSMGAYLIGCVLYATIFGRSPIGLAHDMRGVVFGVTSGEWQVSQEDAAFLQRIAWETVQEYQAGR